MDGQLPQLIEQNENGTPWSKELGRLLLAEAQDDAGRSEARERAVRAIAASPALRQEARELVLHLESRKRPATREEIVALVAGQMPAWGVSAKAAEVWNLTYASYADALAGMPLHAVQECIIRWNRGKGVKDIAAAGFPPRPAQLVTLADEAKRELFMAAYRVGLALKVEETAEAWTAERKAAERQKMIDQGLLTADGKPNFAIGAKAIPNAPRLDQHALAEQLRQASAQTRQMGAPVSRSHIEDGEVL